MIGRLLRKTVAFLITVCIAILAAYLILTSLFPVKYKNEIKSACDEFGVSYSLVLAVIKAESNFEEDAVSVKNAKGLMQLTGDTAAWCAEKVGLSEYNLSEPEDNIRLGTFYLSYLSQMYSGDMKLTAAAYNAGHGNVDKWLYGGKHSADGKELSTIPYKETEKYVKKVLLYNKIYKEITERYNAI